MRDILFKAKRVDNGEWVEGYLFKQVAIADRIYFAIEVIDGTVKAYEVGENTICQFTGLTDDDGNKIWENDIIRVFDMTEEDYIIKWSVEKGAYVICSSATQMVFDDLLSDMFDDTVTVCVVGNIFDNPELLGL